MSIYANKSLLGKKLNAFVYVLPIFYINWRKAYEFSKALN